MKIELKPCYHKAQYYETDQMGIIHHSNFIRWFEEARVDFLEQIGMSYERMEAEGITSPVLEVNCQYKSMVRFGDVVRIEVDIKAYNGVKIEIGYTIYDEKIGALRAVGSSKHCFLSKEGQFLALKKSNPLLDQLLLTYKA